MNVIKRDGTKVNFDLNKIRVAVSKANACTNEMTVEDLDRIAAIVENKCLRESEDLDVEKIQSLVEDTLLKSKFNATAKSYILYRDKRSRIRQSKSALLKEVGKKLMAVDIVNQNANLDERSFGGRKGEASNELSKQYALDYCMSEMARNNHLNNEIYIHDLDSYAVGMHNCLSIPFDDLLAKGFNTRQTDIRPASSVGTAFQLVAVIFQLQSLQQFGGVSATHLDWTMVPYVRKSFRKHYIDGLHFVVGQEDVPNFDKNASIDDLKIYNDPMAYKYAKTLTERELNQAVEGMYHNLNTLQSRSGNQLPFTSINYGTCTLPEGRMIIKALLEGSINGVGKVNRTAIFPCGIFQYMKGVNDKPGTPNYDMYQLALKSTAKRLYPNYANVDWSNNAGYDRDDPKTYFSTMGCRTANGVDINAEPGVNPQTKDGRGNICPVTIIMPTLAMEAEKDVEKFIILLDKKIHEAKDMLIERFNYICNQSASSAKFMYENNTMLGYHPEEGIRSALKHGTLALGQLGLAETLQILINTDQTTEEGMKLAKRIEELFSARCKEFKHEWHYKTSKPSIKTVKEKMIKVAEQKLGRKLTQDEITEIQQYTPDK